MGVQLPSQGAIRTASASLRSTPSATASSTTGLQVPSLFASHRPASLPITQRRNAIWNPFRRKAKPNKKDEAKELMKELGSTRESAQADLMNSLQKPTLVHGSIFADKLKDMGLDDQTRTARPRGNLTRLGGQATHDVLARAVDPDPRSRVRWQRKAVMQRVRRNLDPHAREPKAEWLARTERRLELRSPYLATSHKKLGHLARQVAGKTLADALVQMQFSVKRQARNVRWYLEEARDLAVVRHGMGLGSVPGLGGVKLNKPLEIQTKTGKWIEVRDPTAMYIEQAWVGKGPVRFIKKEYRARGRINILKSPSTSITVVLKEEKTRIREHQERVKKEERKKPWVHLPNRVIYGQRPYYSW